MEECAGSRRPTRPDEPPSYDASTGGNVVNQVQLAFNGLGQITVEGASEPSRGPQRASGEATDEKATSPGRQPVSPSRERKSLKSPFACSRSLA